MVATPATGPDLGPGQPGEALAPPADRRGQDHHVLHRARQADAHHQPDQAGQVAELDRQDRPDQRPRPRDRREVVPEEDPAIRRVEVLAVVELVGRGHPRVVQRRDPGRQERAVVAVGDGQDRQDPQHHRHRVDVRHRGRTRGQGRSGRCPVEDSSVECRQAAPPPSPRKDRGEPIARMTKPPVGPAHLQTSADLTPQRGRSRPGLSWPHQPPRSSRLSRSISPGRPSEQVLELPLRALVPLRRLVGEGVQGGVALGLRAGP